MTLHFGFPFVFDCHLSRFGKLGTFLAACVLWIRKKNLKSCQILLIQSCEILVKGTSMPTSSINYYYNKEDGKKRSGCYTMIDI